MKKKMETASIFIIHKLPLRKLPFSIFDFNKTVFTSERKKITWLNNINLKMFSAFNFCTSQSTFALNRGIAVKCHWPFLLGFQRKFQHSSLPSILSKRPSSHFTIPHVHEHTNVYTSVYTKYIVFMLLGNM